MASRTDLKKISLARLKAAEILMRAEDWDYAGYTLGYVLEFSLKAAICKRLNLNSYPADDKARTTEVRGLFKTHSFDSLIMLSGFSKVFGGTGDPLLFQSWSEATQDFTAEKSWVELRYQAGYWDKTKVERVHNALIDSQRGILTYIRRNRW